MEKVKIKLNGGIMPKKATEGAAAYDLYVPEDVTLSNGRQIIDLKFSMELPQGYAATIQPRSGFSSKGIEVDRKFVEDGTCLDIETGVRVNGDVLRGLIDCDYRGNVGVIIKVSRDSKPYERLVIRKGTRIAQMQIVEVPQVELIEVDELSETDRGEGGFGHTGVR
jgi:dUTP pyrophosphatase